MTTTGTLAGKTIVITGANRGLGKALVDEALGRSPARIYAASRRPQSHSDQRVTALRPDVTDHEQIRAVSEQIDALDLLINNAYNMPCH